MTTLYTRCGRKLPRGREAAARVLLNLTTFQSERYHPFYSASFYAGRVRGQRTFTPAASTNLESCYHLLLATVGAI